jgi:hypothetical protein
MPPKKADFSEFSYGYALTSELVDRYKLRQLGYPLFPSLTEEGKTGGGFDVKLPGVPLFLQFKVPEVLMGSRANEAALLGLPHYRMKLRPLKYSDQHNLLLALEADGNDVFYACPEIDLPEQLNDAFINQTVEDRTWFFVPSDIGALDREEHYIAYVAGASAGYFRSPEPAQELRRISGETIFHRILPERIRTPRNHATYDSLIRAMISIYMEHTGLGRDVTGLTILPSDRSPETVVAHLAQTLFDSQLLIFPDSQ